MKAGKFVFFDQDRCWNHRVKGSFYLWQLANSKITKWEGYELKEENIMELWKKKLPFIKSKAAASLTKDFEPQGD